MVTGGELPAVANFVGLLGVGWVALTGLSVGFLALLGRRTRQRDAVSWSAASAVPVQPVPRHGEIRLMTFEARELDVAHEVAGALGQLQAMAHRHQAELQVAVQPKLTMWADPSALQQMLVGLLSQAIARAAGGAVLVSAGWHGGRVQVTVVDDGPAADHATLLGLLREVEQGAALQGGTFEIDCRKGSGTRVVLRMPGTGAQDAMSADDEASDELPVRDAPWTEALGAT